MKIKYSVLVALLAAGILSAPAMAGVTKSGTGRAGTVKKITNDMSVDSSTNQVIGHLQITGGYGESHGWNPGRNVYDSGKVTADPSNPSYISTDTLINAAAGAVQSAFNEARDAGGRGTYNGHTVSSTHHDYDNRTYRYEFDSSEDLILVGDADNLGNAVAAQGDFTQTLVIEGDYGTESVYYVNGSGVVSPIILDLDGDGKIEASNGKYMPHTCSFTDKDNAIMFDFYGNGFPVVMEWVGANDGLLCRPNADGTVNGTCLFGTATGNEDGYDAMATLDIDRNGYLEGAELDELRVWTDKNRNGRADEGELHTLQSLDITSIGVNHNNYSGTYVRNGKNYKTFDWWPCMIDCRKIKTHKI